MPLAMDQHQSNSQHFCKICKKGFECGRALGEHMRTHGIRDDSWNLNDNEDASTDWEEKHGDGSGNESQGTKRKYALRTNPNRSKNVRVCENCGKEFYSWDSFLEHGKCTTSDGHVESSSHISPPISNGDGERVYGWSKRKRSVRADVGTLNSTFPSSEEIELANCLIMLSGAKPDPLEAGESSASACRDEEPIKFIQPISYYVPAVVDHKGKTTVVPKGLFQCKDCKRVFNSHQALGGHRASHKKVKGCFALRQDQLKDKDDDVIITHHEEYLPTKKSNSMAHHHSNNDTPLTMETSSSSERKPKVHECSICQRTFFSGQALGGHMRCHYITPNAPPNSSTLAKFQQFQDHMELMDKIPKFADSSETRGLKFDLNLPPPAEDPAPSDSTAEIFLQPCLGETTTKEKDNSDNTNSQCCSLGKRKLHHHETENDNKLEEDKNNNNNSTVMIENGEDETDGRVKKLAKLTKLKDTNRGESSSS